MAKIRISRCLSDDDLAAASLFMLEHRHELHLSFTVMDMLTLLYSYMTQGHMVFIVDEQNAVLGVSGYYLGTREQDFQDKEIAFVDVAIIAKANRNGRLFYRGLAYLVNLVATEHPEAKELRLATLTENRYLCRMYGKVANPLYEREGTLGPETVFVVSLDEISTTLNRFTLV